MVLGNLVSTENVEKKKRWIFALGVVYTLVGSVLTQLIFPEQASLVLVFLVCLAGTPLMYNTIRQEEHKDMEEGVTEKYLLKEHFKILEGYMSLFLGITIGFTLLYVLLSGGALDRFFSLQMETLEGINNEITGHSLKEGLSSFSAIFLNNVQVLSIAIVFSFIFGTGAIFILAWNASVIGAAIGNFMVNNWRVVEEGLQSFCSNFVVINFGLFRYAIHGIPEILGYFVGGLAGGIIAFAVISHDFMSKRFEQVVLDSADLVLLSLGLLLVGAFLEVWVTPLIFSDSMLSVYTSMCSV